MHWLGWGCTIDIDRWHEIGIKQSENWCCICTIICWASQQTWLNHNEWRDLGQQCIIGLTLKLLSCHFWSHFEDTFLSIFWYPSCCLCLTPKDKHLRRHWPARSDINLGSINVYSKYNERFMEITLAAWKVFKTDKRNSVNQLSFLFLSFSSFFSAAGVH